MRILVLGSAAGGGFPQWNCNCGNCARVRAGDPAAKPRTQSSLAVSADDENWFLLNASPDLRQQISDNPLLHPKIGKRHSPIQGAVEAARINRMPQMPLVMRSRGAINGKMKLIQP